MTEFERLLREKAAGIIDLPVPAIGQLERHYDSLMRWNQRLNLTTIRKPAEVVERHYCESLLVASRMGIDLGSIVDVGTGPGFPGVPIAAVRPLLTVSLLESNARKCVFLRESTRQFANIEVLEMRSEDLSASAAPRTGQSRFDWLVSRAVKWEDVRETALAVASNVAFLVGEADAEAIMARPGGFVLSEPEKLPWGDRRFLLIGRVSRET